MARAASPVPETAEPEEETAQDAAFADPDVRESTCYGEVIDQDMNNERLPMEGSVAYS